MWLDVVVVDRTGGTAASQRLPLATCDCVPPPPDDDDDCIVLSSSLPSLLLLSFSSSSLNDVSNDGLILRPPLE